MDKEVVEFQVKVYNSTARQVEHDVRDLREEACSHVEGQMVEGISPCLAILLEPMMQAKAVLDVG